MSAENVREHYRREGAQEERKRIVIALDILHVESGQLSHLDQRSGVCKTCRAIALIEGEK